MWRALASGLSLCLVLASVLAVQSPAAAATDADSTATAAADLGCNVKIAVDLRRDRDEPGKTVQVDVLPDCSVAIGQPETVFGPASLMAGRTCQFVNRLIGAGGEGDILTELGVRQDFEYDGVYVTSETSSAWTYNHWSTGWGVINSWKRVNSTTPTPDFSVDGWASFSFFGSWHHDKYQETHAYGDGGCSANFQHNGYVCGGCAVRFYIF